ncbi:serine/threonine-protein kinase PCRK1-like [Impatiens glandulifera]|uniref:serine/threonine-protein kinase PCRK1-like n=1 Tax=Impatiens glandulifera TaxID=253017 RepID=UPI001FB167B3|nr:serine/threonine-protein kinase PCRK1-like [Impatiens glandulifera]
MKCLPFFSREVKCKDEEEEGTRAVPSSNSSSDMNSPENDSFSSLLQSKSNLNVIAFTLSEMKTATKNFSRSSKIGEGGFGCVYKGLIKCDSSDLINKKKKVEVAVKQLGTRGIQGHKEWVAEVNFLGIVEHENLVKLVGYCAEDDERGIQRILVYEYMPNGSVDRHLSATKSSITPLSWALRLKVARDAARGLAHLHEGMEFQIIFRDFKSSNILLDENWNAKLSDFGLARLGPEEGFTHVTTGVKGTLGYAAPEYMQTGHLTSKSDVWGYGVFLYELITGRRPMDRNRPSREQQLLIWIRPYLSSERKFRQILDPRLDWKQHNSNRCAFKIAKVANLCLNRNAKSRPKMSEVLRMVDEILESWNQTKGKEEALEGKATMKPKPEERHWFVRTCSGIVTN